MEKKPGTGTGTNRNQYELEPVEPNRGFKDLGVNRTEPNRGLPAYCDRLWGITGATISVSGFESKGGEPQRGNDVNTLMFEST